METRIGNYAMADAVRLFFAHHDAADIPEIYTEDGDISIHWNGWYITFDGDGIVHLQKGMEQAQTFDDHAYTFAGISSAEILPAMMREYEKNIRRSELIEKYRKKREAILQAAEVLRDEGIMSVEEWANIDETVCVRWVYQQVRKEMNENG